MNKLTALIPMRHHSQRVPGKNYRQLAGKPLYRYIVETLLAVPEINQIVVDTDSEPVMEGLRQDFPMIKLIERPESLRADTISMNEILLYDTAQVESDFYIQTHSTNPLLKPETVSRAIQLFTMGYPTYDSLFSVTRLQTRLWTKDSRPLNHDPAILLQTQDLPPVFEENSCLYLFMRGTLQKNHNRLGQHPLMFEIDQDEAWDIDEELDFDIVDFLMRRQNKKK